MYHKITLTSSITEILQSMLQIEDHLCFILIVRKGIHLTTRKPKIYNTNSETSFYLREV